MSAAPELPKNVVRGPGYVQVNVPEGAWQMHRKLLNYDEVTMFNVFADHVKNQPNKPFLGARRPNNSGGFGAYEWISYQQTMQQIEVLGCGLERLLGGPKHGEFGAIFSINTPEWLIAQHAMWRQSMCVVPLYSTFGLEALSFILQEAELRVAVVNSDLLAELFRAIENLVTKSGRDALKLQYIVRMRRPLGMGEPLGPFSDTIVEQARALGINLVTWEELEAMGKEHPSPAKLPRPDDMHSLMYTSGTTGLPKGVVLTHRAFTLTTDKGWVHSCFDDDKSNEVHISYLPLAHVYEQDFVAFVIRFGASIGFFSGSIPRLFEDVQVLRPTFMCGVPRVWKKLKDKVDETLNEASWLKKTLFQHAFSAKDQADKANTTTWIDYDKWVFSALREKLGGRIKVLFTAAAPIPTDLSNWLYIIFNCRIVQIYGLTESAGGSLCLTGHEQGMSRTTCGIPTINTIVHLRDIPDLNYFTSTNPPKGELVIKSQTNMPYYYKRPDLTAEVIDSEGWLHTGDVAMVNPDGSVSIIDRVKNLFKLAQGEFVQPEYLETLFSRSPLVAQSWVHGDSLDTFVVTLVVPDFTTLQTMVKSKAAELPADVVALSQSLKGPTDPQIRKLYDAPAIRKLVLVEMARIGKESNLPSFMLPKVAWLEPDPWTTENNMCTPTLKIKRAKLKQRYAELLPTLMAEGRALVPS